MEPDVIAPRSEQIRTWQRRDRRTGLERATRSAFTLADEQQVPTE